MTQTTEGAQATPEFADNFQSLQARFETDMANKRLEHGGITDPAIVAADQFYASCGAALVVFIETHRKMEPAKKNRDILLQVAKVMGQIMASVHVSIGVGSTITALENKPNRPAKYRTMKREEFLEHVISAIVEEPLYAMANVCVDRLVDFQTSENKSEVAMFVGPNAPKGF